MSSKLLRPADLKRAPLSTWLPAGANVAQHIVTTRGTEMPAVDSAAEIEARIKAAYAQGRNDAEAAATQRAAQKMEPVVASLNSLIQELADTRRKFRAEAEGDTVKLAIAIARRVLNREISTDPEAILGLVMAAFSKLNARETQRLRIAPPDAPAIQEVRARLSLPASLEIAADASLAPGSAIFETSRGELDASVDTQLAEIERGFADVMRRRR